MDTQVPDRETFDILKQFLGQTYGELHKIDSNIVGASQHLNHKSGDFKRTVTQVLDSVATSPQVRTHGPAANNTPTVTLPVLNATPQIDPDQMEFVFDGSPTASSIQKTLDRIDARIDKIDQKLNNLIEKIS